MSIIALAIGPSSWPFFAVCLGTGMAASAVIAMSSFEARHRPQRMCIYSAIWLVVVVAMKIGGLL